MREIFSLDIFPLALSTHRYYVLHIKETSAKTIHHFKTDFINNIDHMRISGTDPISGLLMGFAVNCTASFSSSICCSLFDSILIS